MWTLSLSRRARLGSVCFRTVKWKPSEKAGTSSTLRERSKPEHHSLCPKRKKNPGTITVPGHSFWQRVKDSNPHIQSQSLLCYLYTNPLYLSRVQRTIIIIRNFPRLSIVFSKFFLLFSNTPKALGFHPKQYQKALFCVLPGTFAARERTGPSTSPFLCLEDWMKRSFCLLQY